MTAVITLAIDEKNDGVVILQDGEVVWRENTFGSIDQYVRFRPNQDEPVILRWGTYESA